MNYELVKQLKDAGFPFKRSYIDDGKDFNTGFEIVPTLSELIEAVKNHPMNIKDIGLHSLRGGYNAWARKTKLDEGSDGSRDCFGSTPKEAFSNLWLELQVKK